MKITEIVYAVFYYMCNICCYLNTAVNWGYWGWDRNKQDFKIFFFLQSESTIEQETKQTIKHPQLKSSVCKVGHH